MPLNIRKKNVSVFDRLFHSNKTVIKDNNKTTVK